MEMKGTDVKENAFSVEIEFEGTEDGVHEDGAGMEKSEMDKSKKEKNHA
jgi:hypothetical protein